MLRLEAIVDECEDEFDGYGSGPGVWKSVLGKVAGVTVIGVELSTSSLNSNSGAKQRGTMLHVPQNCLTIEDDNNAHHLQTAEASARDKHLAGPVLDGSRR